MEGVVASNAVATRAVTGFLQHSTHQLREPTFQQPLYAVLPQMALAAPPLAYGNVQHIRTGNDFSANNASNCGKKGNETCRWSKKLLLDHLHETAAGPPAQLTCPAHWQRVAGH
jgi:hypothetical protein